MTAPDLHLINRLLAVLEQDILPKTAEGVAHGNKLFGAAILATAAAPSVAVALVALTVVGATSVTFLAVGNTTLQLTADPRFRGRVMALWTVAFLGSTPIGAPIIGWVSEQISPRGGLVVGGMACLLAAGVGALALAREHGGGAHQTA